MTIEIHATSTRYPDRGAIQIVIDNTFPDTIPPGYYQQIDSIVRVTDNGTAPVRLIEGTLPSRASQIVIEDHEHPVMGETVYILFASNSEGENRGYRIVVPANPAPHISAWLSVPTRANYDVSIDLVTGYEANRKPQTTVHTIIGRPDPIAIIGVLGNRTGRLTYWCPNYAAVEGILHVYSLGLVTLLRPPSNSALTLYHLATDEIQVHPLTLREGYPERWEVQVPYTEVARPAGPMTGSNLWTFAALKDKYFSFYEVVGAFTTFDDMTIGIES